MKLEEQTDRDFFLILLKKLERHAVRVNYFTPKELFFVVDVDPDQAVRIVNQAIENKQQLFYQIGKSPVNGSATLIIINPAASTVIFVPIPKGVNFNEVQA